jgi:hypothetical protein
VLRKYLSHLHPPLPFLYPPSPTSDLPLMWPVLQSPFIV